MISTVFKRNGYITVFCSLSLMVILSLILVLFEGARINGAKLMCEYAVDIGMDSILAEYHRELFDKYDLPFIDTSYGSGNPSLDNTENHLMDYVEKNLQTRELITGMLSGDLYGLSAEEVSISMPSHITDSNGLVFRRQAEEERKQMMGITLVSSVGRRFSNLLSEYPEEGKYDSLQQEVEGEISAAKNMEYEVEEGKFEKIEINNPADGVNALRGTGILVLAMKDTSSISQVTFREEDRLSYRKISEGIGINPDRYDDETLMDKFCFREYITEYFGNYREPGEDSYLKYEQEYILAGKNSDLENLEFTAKRIFAIREASNTEYLMSNVEKRAIIKAVADTVAAITLIPGLDNLLEYSILFAWSFGESVVDLRTLFSGGKVPLIKSDISWKTDLDSVLENSFMDYQGSEEGDGLSYDDYLKILLFTQDIETQSVRSLDAMELTIRQTKGNAGFRIDGCIEGAALSMNIRDSYGDKFTLTRNCYY